MIFKVILIKKVPDPFGTGVVLERHQEVELTSNFRMICKDRNCRMEVEIIGPTKQRTTVPRMIRCGIPIGTKDEYIDGSYTNFVPIDIIFVETTHDHYVEEILS